ncbi:MAG: T9SS type A sorting domain-containing protein [Cytophagales bacterium]|nr:T9SS type A sorting domain-containing protein [Bernardetiaceae bacterium]MDW8205505.1 T9SS type A sorting domain-containing protein [Cytophagales bacterium]
MLKNTAVIWLCLIGFVATAAHGQLRLIPFSPQQIQPLHASVPSRVEENAEDTSRLSLPFFDDFSTNGKPWLHKGRADEPDTSRWVPRGGTFVNNTLAVNPPSFNVATFDGISANGRPYDFANVFAVGITDMLVSKRIDLDTMKPQNNIFLSFFWQSEGMGEKPDEEDYLAVEFLDRNNNWIRRWQQNGGQATADFRYVILPVQTPEFLHKNFRFRFVRYGRQAGAFDTWHVDYIYMNKNRNPNDNSLLDIAANNIRGRFLKRYSAMPMRQFVQNPQAEIADSVFLSVSNLDRRFNVFAYDALLKETISGRELGLLADTTAIIREFQRNFLVGAVNRGVGKRPPVVLPLNQPRMILETIFRLNTGERDDLIPPINFRNNDTLSSITVFDNYYAYDDGSAEFAISFNQQFGKLAYRYQLNTQATLSHIDLYFVPILTNLQGETYNLRVWKRLDEQTGGVRDSVLLVQNTFVTYSDSLNKFIRIPLSRRIPLQGSFFIGVEQLSSKPLTLGFDRNTDSGSEIWVNVANKWERNTQIKGSIMLRPVFAEELVTALPDEQLKTLSTVVYPNPSSGIFSLQGRVNQLTVYDLQGRIVFQKDFAPGELAENLSLEHCPSGIYLLQIVNEQHTKIAKLLLQKQ